VLYIFGFLLFFLPVLQYGALSFFFMLHAVILGVASSVGFAHVCVCVVFFGTKKRKTKEKEKETFALLMFYILRSLEGGGGVRVHVCRL
jgi:Ca2+/Na+ antiporter